MKPYYEHAGITIYHGDCREILPQLPKVDLVLTDPPYGIGLGNQLALRDGRRDRVLLKPAFASYDDTLCNLRTIVVPTIARLLQTSKRAIVFCAGFNVCEFPKPNVLGGIFWAAAHGRNAWGFASFTPALLYGPGCRVELGSRPTAIASVESAEVNGHPCPKPINAMRHFVKLGSEEGDLILDPFMGSGTTLVAAKNLNRRAIGIEIEERYCEIAAKRLAQEVFEFREPAPQPEQMALAGQFQTQ